MTSLIIELTETTTNWLDS